MDRREFFTNVNLSGKNIFRSPLSWLMGEVFSEKKTTNTQGGSVLRALVGESFRLIRTREAVDARGRPFGSGVLASATIEISELSPKRRWVLGFLHGSASETVFSSVSLFFDGEKIRHDIASSHNAVLMAGAVAHSESKLFGKPLSLLATPHLSFLFSTDEGVFEFFPNVGLLLRHSLFPANARLLAIVVEHGKPISVDFSLETDGQRGMRFISKRVFDRNSKESKTTLLSEGEVHETSLASNHESEKNVPAPFEIQTSATEDGGTQVVLAFSV